MYRVAIRAVLFPVRVLWRLGRLLLPGLWVSGRVRPVRGVLPATWLDINDIFIVDEQLILHINSHDHLGDHKHQLQQQQRERQPDSWSPAGPEHDYGWHVRKQQVVYWVAIWAVLFPIWVLWLL